MLLVVVNTQHLLVVVVSIQHVLLVASAHLRFVVYILHLLVVA